MEAEHIEVAELQAVYLTLSRELVLASMTLEDEEGSREKDYAVGNGFGDAGEGSRGCRGHITVSGQGRSSHCHSVFTLRITGINVSIGNVGKGDPFSSTSTYIGQTGEERMGSLNLININLAGSERLNVSFAQGRG